MVGALAPMLDWLDVEMGDMLSSVSVGVDKPSYDDEPPVMVFPLDADIHMRRRAPDNGQQSEGRTALCRLVP